MDEKKLLYDNSQYYSKETESTSPAISNLRELFFSTLKEICPEVITSLRDETLPIYIKVKKLQIILSGLYTIK